MTVASTVVGPANWLQNIKKMDKNSCNWLETESQSQLFNLKYLFNICNCICNQGCGFKNFKIATS